jgi:branched-chain amino acid transport system ATP-binding protein
MKNAMLEIENLTSGYGKLIVLHDLSLKVYNQEILAIIGPNGSGKSTLIKSIYGIADVFKGKIVFNGREITHLRPDEITKMGVSYIPQINNVFSNLTVEENLKMGAYIRTDKSKIKDDIEKLYQLFPSLRERRKQKAKTLSGGERQMLAIARGLMVNPKALMLDEPTAGLAPKLVTELLKKIVEIRESGVTILLVEQHAEKALQIADRGIILIAGRKVFDEDVKTLLSREDISEVFLGKKLAS